MFVLCNYNQLCHISFREISSNHDILRPKITFKLDNSSASFIRRKYINVSLQKPHLHYLIFYFLQLF